MRDEVFWRINGNDNLLQLLFNTNYIMFHLMFSHSKSIHSLSLTF